jgi:hypothetical protein
VTTVVTRRPQQAERIARELREHAGYQVEVAGCLLTTDAPSAAVIEAGFRSGVQAESMAGLPEPAPKCRSTVHRWRSMSQHVRVQPVR